MTRDEAEKLLKILYRQLDNGALDYMEDGTLDALDMAREALEQPQPCAGIRAKAIEILKNVDWVGSGAKGMIQDAIDLLEGAGNDTKH